MGGRLTTTHHRHLIINPEFPATESSDNNHDCNGHRTFLFPPSDMVTDETKFKKIQAVKDDSRTPTGHGRLSPCRITPSQRWRAGRLTILGGYLTLSRRASHFLGVHLDGVGGRSDQGSWVWPSRCLMHPLRRDVAVRGVDNISARRRHGSREDGSSVDRMGAKHHGGNE